MQYCGIGIDGLCPDHKYHIKWLRQISVCICSDLSHHLHSMSSAEVCAQGGEGAKMWDVVREHLWFAGKEILWILVRPWWEGGRVEGQWKLQLLSV